jgi:flagellar basal-body rod protein FlgF
MDRLIYTAMNGAKQIMLQQANNNHNLANVNTTGFRADLDAFKNLPMKGPGYESRVYSQEQSVGVDQSPGSLMQTGRALDVAVQGEGFIAVQAKDGSEVYTRAGNLRIGSGGMLETATGELVLGSGGIISLPPYEKLEIGTDGTVSVRPLGQTASTLAAVDQIKLVKPEIENLIKREDGLLQHKDNVPQAPDTEIKLVSGALESSNVNAVDALVNMIELSRLYELNIKMMESADATDRASATLMRLN